MNVKELITELQEYDPNTEVLITDGMRCYCYSGNYNIKPYFDGSHIYVDIGIDNCFEGDE